MEEKIYALIDTLNADERNIFKNALSRQIDSFFDKENNLLLETPQKEDEFNLLAFALKKLAPTAYKIPLNGIAYYGRPSWVNEELLNSLIEEANQRRFAPLDKIDHFLGCGGTVADRLAESDELLSFVSKYIGPVSKTGIASYIYYDLPGSGIRPHVDTDVFSVNLILMLKHDHEESQLPSATTVFPAYQKPQSYRLQIGEVLIMYGSSIIHTRSIIQEKEIVHLLTIGFNPIEKS